MQDDSPILVSACLLGLQCRYDGKAKLCAEILDALRKGKKLIPLCPEQLGGLPTPRKSCEILGGDGSDVLAGDAKVLNNESEDCTDAFINGAEQVLYIAHLYGVKEAWLMKRSPSCGVGTIYDGSFSGVLQEGDGVCATLLKSNDIKIKAFETDGELSPKGEKDNEGKKQRHFDDRR